MLLFGKRPGKKIGGSFGVWGETTLLAQPEKRGSFLAEKLDKGKSGSYIKCIVLLVVR